MPPVEVSALRQQRAEKVDSMSAIFARASAEGRDMTEVEATAYDELKAEANGFGNQITRAEEIIAMKALGAKPVVVEGAAAAVQPRVEPQVREAMDRKFAVVHMVKALAATKGNLRDAAEFADKVLHDAEVSKALAAGIGTSGGFVVPDQYVSDIIEFLRPASAVLSLNPLQMPMPNGTITVPKLAGGSSATYIGENTNIVATQPSFGQLRLTARKLAALVPISNDLIRFSTPSADTIVRDDLVSAIAQRQDLAFIRDAGIGNAPKGLRYWAPAANVIPANGTVNLANVTTDIGKAVLALKNANVRMLRPGWIFSPRTEEYLLNVRDGLGNFAFRPEMLLGKLRMMPYRTTTQIPNNLGGGSESEIYLADFADVVVADVGSLRLDASTEAAYFDGSNVVSSYSLDQTVVRAIVEHDIGMRHDFSVAVLTAVLWSP